MRERRGNKSISGIAALLLLTVFAAGLLSVLLGGAGVYRRLSARDAAAYDLRTCTQYLANRVRQAPTPAAVAVSRFGDGDSLLIREDVDGEEYRTQIYCHNGWLMEIFAAADADLAPGDGEKLLPAKTLSVTDDGGLLCIRIANEKGGADTVWLSVRGGRQGGYEE